ncbi:MAG: Fic family protein [Endomicrobium sp.]|jgi:Fic family protein|nr:Fic family protein [Endomicrobium sp.]
MKGINILANLRNEKRNVLKGGLYHKTQIALAYNSNRIEGSTLTEEQTRFIFETNTIGFKDNDAVLVNDIIETVNHFKVFDYLLDIADVKLSQEQIKTFHKILKNDAGDDKKGYPVGEYKKYRNEVAGRETTEPKFVIKEMAKLLSQYNRINKIKLEDIVKFHKDFEYIHPFQDGNGRVGRLIMFKECLKNNIIPFIIFDKTHKQYYYRGLTEFNKESGFLIGTCQSAQDVYQNWVDYFYANVAKSEKDNVPNQVLTKKQFIKYLSDIIIININKNGFLAREQIDKLLEPEIQTQNLNKNKDAFINDLLTKMRRENLIRNSASRKKPKWEIIK